MQIGNLNEFHHRLLRLFIREGDTVVDATAGNGHDSLFLAETVGRSGRLYGFDVQEEAIEAAQRRLNAGGIEAARYRLILDGHEKIAHYVEGGIGAVVYNLGYLPGGDHAVVTTGQATVRSLEASLGLLRPGGVATITVYYGHDGGEEAQVVGDYVRTLDSGRFKVMDLRYANMPKNPPSLFVIQYTQ